MSTFLTIYNHCDAAMSVVQEQLTAVKSILAEHETEQQSLVTEKSDLEVSVTNLRLEKEQLEKDVANMEERLRDFRNGTTEDSKCPQVLTQIPAAVAPPATGADGSHHRDLTVSHGVRDTAEHAPDDPNVEDSQETTMLDDTAELTSNDSITSFDDRSDDDTEDAIIQDSQETCYQTQADCQMETQHSVFEEETSTPEALESQEEDTSVLATQEMLSFSLDTPSVVSVTSPTSSARRRRRASKANDSPKKWRRMMRTHRLKSILLVD